MRRLGGEFFRHRDDRALRRAFPVRLRSWPPSAPRVSPVLKSTPECWLLHNAGRVLHPEKHRPQQHRQVNSYSSSGISSIPPCVPTTPAF